LTSIAALHDHALLHGDIKAGNMVVASIIDHGSTQVKPEGQETVPCK
jgi:tRNA A-37 threonylcarbamoyl transferase component Bud32